MSEQFKHLPDMPQKNYLSLTRVQQFILHITNRYPPKPGKIKKKLF
jgi:hypothetical protein